MTEYKYGELADWNDADTKSRSDFMRLTQGDNIVRIFTLPFQFHVCWVKDASGANRKLRSALKDCPLIKRGEKLQTRWMLGVINRETNSAEILEIGSQIYNGIKKLINDGAWGDPRKYDLNIVRGKPNDNPLYTVHPRPPTELSDADKAMVEEFMGNTELGKMTQPPTAEEVSQRLAEIDGLQPPQRGGNGSQQQRQQQDNQSQQQPPIDENTFNFDQDQL